MLLDKGQLVRQVEHEVRRLTSRTYHIDWVLLSIDDLREIARLLRDLDFEKTAAVVKAKRTPWRR